MKVLQMLRFKRIDVFVGQVVLHFGNNVNHNLYLSNFFAAAVSLAAHAKIAPFQGTNPMERSTFISGGF